MTPNTISLLQHYSVSFGSKRLIGGSGVARACAAPPLPPPPERVLNLAVPTKWVVIFYQEGEWVVNQFILY